MVRLRSSAPERQHRPQTVHRLGELHDHRRDRRSGAAVDPPRPVLEPPGGQRDRDEGRERDQPERDVEQQQGDADRDHREQAGDQPLQSLLGEIAQGVQVAGHPGDHPARGVALVERDAQRLGVVEHPAAQVQQNSLRDLRGEADEERLARGVGDPRSQVGQGRVDQWSGIPGHQRGDRGVDAVGHRQRPDQIGQLAEHHHRRGKQGPPAMRSDQRPEQPPGPRLELDADVTGDVVGVLGRNAAPGVVRLRLQDHRGGRPGGGHDDTSSSLRPASRTEVVSDRLASRSR